jgi:hypothetical protein
VQMMYPLPNPRISHTDARLFMNMVQIRLKSQDFRIQRFQLDLKIVYEFQLRRISCEKHFSPGISAFTKPK